MKPPAAPEFHPPPGTGRDAVESGEPGLPGLRTWRVVYGFVLGCFVAYVVLLAWFTRLLSR
ncbi:MAG TPA: hypothetical protein VLW52_11185 [Opitutaceae bacterium]|nr:hypothetical protein [Opitutaceae bacterium]